MEEYIRLVKYEESTEAQTVGAKPSTSETVVRYLFNGDGRVNGQIQPSSIMTHGSDQIYGAQITQEYRRAGQMKLTLPKSCKEILDFTHLVEVKSPLLKSYYKHNNLRYPDPTGVANPSFFSFRYNTSGDGQEGATFVRTDFWAIWEKDVLEMSGWRGRVQTIREDEGCIEVTLGGELADLSYVYIDPYETTEMDREAFGVFFTARHNEQVDRKSMLYFGVQYYMDLGYTVVRSAQDVSSANDALRKVIDLRKLEPLILFDGSNRYLVVREQPTEVDGILTSFDILSASHEENVDSRYRHVVSYGVLDESTGVRVKGEYTTSDSDIDHIAKENTTMVSTYDDIKLTSTLNQKSEETYNAQITDSHGISVKLTSSAAKKVQLGGVYTINYPAANISGNYRLIKRTIDFLNPANNSHTFGVIEGITSLMDETYVTQDEIDAMY